MQIYRFDPAVVAAAYSSVGSQVVELVDSIPSDGWTAKALGEWDLRTLVAHTMRSFSAVTNYLASGDGEEIELFGPISYYTTAFARNVSTDEIDRRAIAEAEALGDDVSAKFRASYEAAVASVQQASPEAAVETPIGVISLADYLPTRIVELVVHGEDLKAATGFDATFDAVAVEVASMICGSTASRRGVGVEAVLAFTGRQPLRPDFDVLGFE